MAAKKGNSNAKGNSGGKPYSAENREKAATLKGLALDWMMEVMKGEDEKLKKEVVLKIATTCIPTVLEGDPENPFITIIKYANGNTVTTENDKQNTTQNQ